MIDKVQNKTLMAPLVLAMAAIVALAICLMVGASTAWAGAQPGSPTLEDLNKGTYIVSLRNKSGETEYHQFSSEKSPKAKIAHAKSSKPGVADVEVYGEGGFYSMQVLVKKVGTTKITYKWGGKKHTVKFVVKKYTSPVKSFKVGSKNYAAKFTPKAIGKTEGGGSIVAVKAGSKPLTGKVNIKLAKGWKLLKVWYWTQSGNNWKMHYAKNGASVSKAKTLYAWVAKGKQRERLSLFVV